MEATKVPIDKQVDKKIVVRTYGEILLGHKNNKMLPFETAWVDLEGIILSEIPYFCHV